jgi:hypothetical protein
MLLPLFSRFPSSSHPPRHLAANKILIIVIDKLGRRATIVSLGRQDFLRPLSVMLVRHAVLLTSPNNANRSLWSYHHTGTFFDLSPLLASLTKTAGRVPKIPILEIATLFRSISFLLISLRTLFRDGYPSTLSFSINSAHFLPRRRVHPLPTFGHSNVSTRRRFLSPIFRTLFQVPYPVSPAFATLAKTPGVWGILPISELPRFTPRGSAKWVFPPLPSKLFPRVRQWFRGRVPGASAHLLLSFPWFRWCHADEP